MPYFSLIMKNIVKELIPYVVIVIAVLLIKKFIVSPIRVIGPSMKDTLQNKDIMILDKISYRFSDIKRFDIVVVSYENDYIIKRVIGLPGDTVEYKDNTLYINGKLYDEKYLATGTVTDNFTISDINQTEKIPEGYYLVLGDNREESKDSRSIGLIKRSKIEGKTKLTIFPFSRIGIKK